MGFQRIVTLACDGPCGTALPKFDKAPPGWSKLMMSMYEILAPGQKPTNKPVIGWFCPKCSVNIVRLLKDNHFEVSKEGERE